MEYINLYIRIICTTSMKLLCYLYNSQILRKSKSQFIYELYLYFVIHLYEASQQGTRVLKFTFFTAYNSYLEKKKICTLSTKFQGSYFKYLNVKLTLLGKSKFTLQILKAYWH